MERLDEEVQTLRPLVEKYHDLRAQKAATDEKLRGSRWNDVLSAICISAGSVGIGAASKYLPLDLLTGTVLLAVSIVLVGVGIIAKVFK